MRGIIAQIVIVALYNFWLIWTQFCNKLLQSVILRVTLQVYWLYFSLFSFHVLCQFGWHTVRQPPHARNPLWRAVVVSAKEKVRFVSVFANLNNQCITHWTWNVPSQLAKEVLDICWWDWFDSSKKRGKQKIHFEAWSKYDGRCYQISMYGPLSAVVMFPVTKW